MSITVFFPIVLSFVLCVLFVPLTIKFCRFYNLYDSVNARKIHSGNIPRLGGVAMMLAFLIGIIVYFIANYSNFDRNPISIVIAGVIIFVFGVFDDIFELPAVVKLVVQVIASVLVVVDKYSFHQIFKYSLPPYIGILLTFCWILGIINAYNLIDGLDGLCGMLSLSALVTYGIILKDVFAEGSIISLILAASVLGFLVFNLPFPDAKIFMGDGGSQFLGFMIATIPLYSVKFSERTTLLDNFEYNKFLALLIIVSIPMIDTIAAIWRRLRDHKPIMSPDKYHLHHKFLNIGFNKRHTLLIISIIQVCICASVILVIFKRKTISIPVMSAVYVFILCFFTVLHYASKAVTRRLLNRDKALRDGNKAVLVEEDGVILP